MRRWIVLLVWLWPAAALAHPGVDRARAMVQEGRYEEADAELARALGGTLSRDDLIAVYETRALLDHARRDTAGLERTLTALASVSPSHRFGPRFPPDIAQQFVEVGRNLGGRLRLRVAQAPSAAGVTVEPRVEHDPASLVRTVRIRVFDAASGTWRDTEPPVTAAAGREVLCFVEAIGPGGAVLAQEGSAEAPLRVQGPGAPASVGGPGPAQPALDGGDEGGFPDWGYVVVIGGVALGIAAIVAMIVYAVENPAVEWDPTSPMMQSM